MNKINYKDIIGALIVLGLIILSGFGVPSYAMTTPVNSNSSIPNDTTPVVTHAHAHHIWLTVTTDDQGNTSMNMTNNFICDIAGCHVVEN